MQYFQINGHNVTKKCMKFAEALWNNLDVSPCLTHSLVI